MGILRTIQFIASNPFRSRFWKVADITLLVVLWGLTVAAVVIWQDGNVATKWDVIVPVLFWISLAASARSWYRSPRVSKRARQRRALQPQDPAPSQCLDGQDG